jgi:3-hydroxyphenylacetate 6-hydroxylase
MPCRASNQKNFDGNPLINEINAVESEVGKYRSTSSNIKNYVPLFRLLDPLIITLPGNSLQKALDIGRRRLRYHAALLDTLKSEISKDEDKPCIQGNMLKNPETKNLTDLERLSVSLSIMAVSLSVSTLHFLPVLSSHRKADSKKKVGS